MMLAPIVSPRPPARDYDPEAHGAECSRCPLRGRTVVPPTEAARRVRLAIVGEAPGRMEVSRGEVFCGPSGRVLDNALDDADFDRTEAHITNVLLCRGDDDDEVKAAIPCCAPRLGRELAALPPNVPILALGAPAAKVLLARPAIQKTRGFVWKAPDVTAAQVKTADRAVVKWKGKARESKARDARALTAARHAVVGRTVFPSVHPAFLLRGADAWKPVFTGDVKRAVRWARRPFKLEDDGEYIETADAVVIRRETLRLSTTVAVDVETDGPDPMRANLLCVGISDGKRTIVISPWKPGHARLLNAALKDRVVVTHNGPSYDEIVLARYGVSYTRNEDTLLAHHAFASHLRQGLDHVVSVYCDAGPWKAKFKTKGAEEKGYKGFGVKDEDLARYNAADVRLTARCWERMQPDLESEMSVYHQDMQLAALCRRMQVAGMRVDDGRRRALAKALRYRAAALKGEMRGLVKRRSFHPSKPSEIRKALYGKFNVPYGIMPPTKTGLPSTSSGVLEALRGNGTRAGTLADLVLRWRSAEKTRSTFLEGIDFSLDGRVHPSWRAFGTVTGRISARGPNLMNLPRMSKDPTAFEEHVRSIYVPAEGCVFVYFDLSQSEMRAAAYVSGDENFIKSCESDVHTSNAILLFPMAKELLLTDAKGAGKKFRDIAKNAGFGVLYGAEALTVYLFLLSKGFDVTLDDVETMLSYIREAYARYYEFCAENIERCKRVGHLRTALSGRIRWLGWHVRPTEAMNFMIQSFIADLMNERLVEMEPRLPKGSRIVAQIHDACIVEAPARDAEHVKDVIKATWARKIDIAMSGKSFVMPIDLKVGESWGSFG